MTTATATGAIDHTETRQSIRFWTGWSLATFVLSLMLWVGFLTVGGVFYTLSDGVALLMAATMIPVMIGYDRLLESRFGPRSVWAKWVGVVGMILAGAGSLVLLTSEVSHEFLDGVDGLSMQLVGFGIEGIWFLMVAAMAGAAGLFSRRLAMACYLTGVGFLLAVPGSVTGPDGPLVIIGGLISFVGFLSWAIWSRQELAG